MGISAEAYRRLLGTRVPPNEGDHYQLLGLTRFESDRSKMEQAALELEKRLQAVTSGEDLEPAQQLLNRLATARLCLLSERKKLEYDRQLGSSPSTSPATDAEALPTVGRGARPGCTEPSVGRAENLPPGATSLPPSLEAHGVS